MLWVGIRCHADVRQQNTHMPGGRGKPISEMTRAEIYSVLIAFTVIGGFIIAVSVGDMVFRHGGVLSLAGILFAVTVVGVTYFRAIRELRRRKKV
jgi:hypothetical protein